MPVLEVGDILAPRRWLLPRQPLQLRSTLSHRPPPSYDLSAMNWTGGRLPTARQSRTSRKAILNKQKQHFAKVRTQLQNGSSPRTMPFRPNFLIGDSSAFGGAIIPFHRHSGGNTRRSKHQPIRLGERQETARHPGPFRQAAEDLPTQDSQSRPYRLASKSDSRHQHPQPNFPALSKREHRLSCKRTASAIEPTTHFHSPHRPSDSKHGKEEDTPQQSLEKERRKLLRQEDWAGIALSRPLHMSFSSHRSRHQLSKRRKVHREIRHQKVIPPVGSMLPPPQPEHPPAAGEQYLMSGVLPVDADDIRVRVGTGALESQATPPERSSLPPSPPELRREPPDSVVIKPSQMVAPDRASVEVDNGDPNIIVANEEQDTTQANVKGNTSPALFDSLSVHVSDSSGGLKRGGIPRRHVETAQSNPWIVHADKQRYHEIRSNNTGHVNALPRGRKIHAPQEPTVNQSQEADEDRCAASQENPELVELDALVDHPRSDEIPQNSAHSEGHSSDLAVRKTNHAPAPDPVTADEENETLHLMRPSRREPFRLVFDSPSSSASLRNIVALVEHPVVSEPRKSIVDKPEDDADEAWKRFILSEDSNSCASEDLSRIGQVRNSRRKTSNEYRSTSSLFVQAPISLPVVLSAVTGNEAGVDASSSLSSALANDDSGSKILNSPALSKYNQMLGQSIKPEKSPNFVSLFNTSASSGRKPPTAPQTPKSVQYPATTGVARRLDCKDRNRPATSQVVHPSTTDTRSAPASGSEAVRVTGAPSPISQPRSHDSPGASASLAITDEPPRIIFSRPARFEGSSRTGSRAAQRGTTEAWSGGSIGASSAAGTAGPGTTQMQISQKQKPGVGRRLQLGRTVAARQDRRGRSGRGRAGRAKGKANIKTYDLPEGTSGPSDEDAIED
jgi:hypothetical protein